MNETPVGTPKGYWVAHVTVTDAAAYQAYRAAAAPVLKRFGARFLALGGVQSDLEGQARPHTVIVEFADAATARACHASPEYQATIALRTPGAEVDLTLVEGL